MIKVAAFDKAGTLTFGKPAVTDVLPLQGNADELISFAAGLERFSEHPLARAILEEARVRGIALPEVEAFEALAGAGAKGELAGEIWYIGNSELFADLGVDLTGSRAIVADWQGQGKTVVLMGNRYCVRGVIALQDRVRTRMRVIIDELHTQGMRVVMLTGDNERTARAVAAAVGIADVRAALKPNQKVEAIRELEQHTVTY